MEKIRLEAPAKINLGLDVLRKRDDGYHEVRMIMQTISLKDEILLEKTEEPGIYLRTNLKGLPTDERNLAYRAAGLLMGEFEIDKGLRIELNKTIPAAAGMAGGSSDAAAVLLGVNRLFDLGLGKRELMERGVSIGADVPYCILGGAALAEGIGEILTPLPSLPPCRILVAKPSVDVSTGFIYSSLRLEKVNCHPDIDGMMEAIRNQDLLGICSRMGNVLETVTVSMHPVIGEIKAVMKREGALNALMSGSGPSVFGVFKEVEKAEAAKERLEAEFDKLQVFLAEILA